MNNHTEDVAGTGEDRIGPDGVLKRETLLFDLTSRIADILSLELVDLVIGRVRKHVVAVVLDEEFVSLTLRMRDGFP